MLQLVGTGIAMGNASDLVKQHADMITDSVDRDGIALAFTSLFNID
jgi:hydroxymethylpyrimidine pyrophosphatase-like HAD family hydrolase